MNDASPMPQYRLVELGWLRPYENNARTHGPEQVEQIAASIREFGFTNPILALPDGRVIAGHGRLQAVASMDWRHVPALVCWCRSCASSRTTGSIWA
jgi:ParB-like chromosome segregation protein Spo0J